MPDIFDQIAGSVSAQDTGGGGGDIFDQIAAQTSPTLLDNVTEDIKEVPGAVVDLISSIPSGAKNIYESVTSPQEALESGTLEKTIRGTGTIASGVAGAGTGATFGGSLGTLIFPGVGTAVGGLVGGALGGAAGMLGFDKLNQLTESDAPTTPEEDLAKLRKNTVQGVVMGAPLEGIGGALKKVGSKIEVPTPEDLQVQDLGIKLSDVKKANKYRPEINGERPIEYAISGAKERGVFTGPDDIGSIEARNDAALDTLGESVHGEGGLLKAADNVIKARGLSQVANTAPESLGWWKSLDDFVNKKITATNEFEVPQAPLEFNQAKAFIESSPFQAEALKKQLADRQAIINNLWDGTLAGLSKIKTKMGKIAYVGTTDSRALDQAITRDLRSTIERRANEAVPGLGDAIKAQNSKMADHITLRPIIENAKNKAIQQGFKKAPDFGFKKIANQMLSGAMKGGALGFMTGGHYPGTTGGLVGGAVIGGGKALLESPSATRAALTGAGEVLNTAGLSAAPIAEASRIDTEEAISPEQEAIDNIMNDKPTAKPATPTIVKAARTPEVESPAEDAGEVGEEGTQAEGQAAEQPDMESLLKAVGYVESANDPSAVSPKGAKGKYQFMDATAKDALKMAKKQGLLPDDAEYDPKDDKQQKKLAQAYLGFLLDHYDGDTKLALAAYNYGFGAVDKLLAASKTESFDEIEGLLPKETRLYVPKVIKNLEA